MTKTDWTEGKGLRDGYPDPDWSSRAFINSWPDNDGWNVHIVWGSTWGNLACAVDIDFNTAMDKAVKMAIKEKCPTNWLPKEGDN